MKIVGFQELSLDQVEKGHTSLFSVFKFNFHSWLQVTVVNFSGTDCAEYWVLVDWMQPRINFDVAGLERQFRSVPYVVEYGI